MGLMTGDDWAQMTADLAAARGDNPTSIVIRRGAGAQAVTLAAQSVRIVELRSQERTPAGQAGGTPGTSESRGRVLVLGGAGLNIQVDDRFTAGGVLYRVKLVQPNRRVDTQAEVEAVE
jgi:hypothetical protein